MPCYVVGRESGAVQARLCLRLHRFAGSAIWDDWWKLFPPIILIDSIIKNDFLAYAQS